MTPVGPGCRPRAGASPRLSGRARVTGLATLIGLALVTGTAGITGTAQTRPSRTLRDVTASAGLRMIHENGAAGAFRYPELFGGGVAVLDLDSDGDADLLFVNGKRWGATASPAGHRLYRNDGRGHFTDATVGSGIDTLDVYALGASVADYDNDGRDDVFVTTVDGGRLLHNEGRRFVDVSRVAGLRRDGFSVSAAWLDYDRDGLADLLVGNYVVWTPAVETTVHCTQMGVRGYCGPDAYRPTSATLYRNRGGGRFEDVTRAAGFGDPSDKVMGIAVLDYDSDGWPDVFLGSDRVPAKLLRNDHQGHFLDRAVPLGVAMSEHGVARANMGVDAADIDRSGRASLAVGNFLNEMLGLYLNAGQTFRDIAPRSAVGRASLLSVTWAVCFLDLDLDGWPDLLAVNGGTDESQGRDQRARTAQSPLWLRNLGAGTFENASAALGPDFVAPTLGRGAAYLDADGDGDLDLALTTLRGPARLLRNEGPADSHWLRVRLVGHGSTRSALGAVVRLRGEGGAQWQQVHSGSSYASQSELTLTFGLGPSAQPVSLTVEWPSGRTQRLDGVRPNQVLVIDEPPAAPRARQQ